MSKIKRYEVLETEIEAGYDDVFSYISDPKNLPKWALLFEEADDSSAVLNLPDGKMKILLKTLSNDTGVIDWHMHMPNGHVEVVHSRVSRLPSGNSLYVFALNVPPVPDKEVRDTLKSQKKLVTKELANLREILASNIHN